MERDISLQSLKLDECNRCNGSCVTPDTKNLIAQLANSLPSSEFYTAPRRSFIVGATVQRGVSQLSTSEKSA